METQMDTYPILFGRGVLRSWICGETTCRAYATILKKYHNITEDWEGKKYYGIDLKWYYDKITCRATMDGYILDLSKKYQHMQPKKPQYSPHKHRPIDYGATQQLVQPIG